MHHCLAYWTTALAQNASLTALGVLNDPVIPQQNGRYQMPFNARILGAQGFIPDVSVARLDAPSLRRISLPYITPVIAALAPPDMCPLPYEGGGGPDLEKTEELAFVASRGGAGTSDAAGVVFITDRMVAAPTGPIITIHGTAACVPTKGLWGQGAITLDQTLPSGRYAVVGLDVYGTNTQLARLIFPGQVFRPGCITQQAIGQFNGMQFRYGRFGLYGYFDSFAQPQVEVFGSGTATTQDVFLDLVKVS